MLAGLIDVTSPSTPCVVTVISLSCKAIDFLPGTRVLSLFAAVGIFAAQVPPLQSPDTGEAGSWLQQEFRLAMSRSFLFPFLSLPAEHKCPVDQREQLEETLPLILGLILGLVIVITLCVYHIHHKLTANQVQIPRDRSQYKHMG